MISLTFFSFLTGACLSLEVRQTPEEILIKPGGRVEMVCQHSRTYYRQMLWYKYSTENNLMDLIGNLYNGNTRMEEPLGRDFKISGDLSGNTAKKSTLVIEDAGLKHSAIYFCAAREALLTELHKHIYIMIVQSLCLLVLLHSGFSVTVLQSEDQVSRTGDSVKFNCSLGSGYKMDRYYMYWYRQTVGGDQLHYLMDETDRKKGFSATVIQSEDQLHRHIMIVQSLCLLVLLHSGFSVTVLQSEDQVSRSGDTVTIQCRVGAEYRMNDCYMYRYRQTVPGAQLHYLVYEDDRNNGNMSFKISEGNCDWQEVPVYFGSVTRLTVLENGMTVTKPSVQVLRPSINESRIKSDEQRHVTLACVASNFYPDHVSVTWLIDGETVTRGVSTDPKAVRVPQYYRITSRLRVPVEEWLTEKKKFICRVSFFDGKDTVYPEDSVERVEPTGQEVNINTGEEVTISRDEDVTISREEYSRITQMAKLSYVVLIFKSCVYAVFIVFLMRRLQHSTGKNAK
ncbi:M1-specific T cell receptor beta chain-like [Synchiropus splendidus]|uniref:M1-specific T cell receptor beta chain-like n=1 Tax=Synchiropus splendidus TaxID=270530 RepID=UPI00237E0DA3|nr:M1-specific T cell receptor beta chain-like [Synchiropus splendidus]